MLTISQLAAHAGVTVRAVRHYHKIGLLPEPERDRSGYRDYPVAAVVRLVRIHTLASAGVPLARVQELLDADPPEFAAAVREIDKDLRAEIRRLRDTRTRLARLAAGDHLVLPDSVLGYLDRVRGLGVDERYIEMERDAWIMVVAQMQPHEVDQVMAKKHEDLDDPDMVKMYGLVSDAVGTGGWSEDDPRLEELADVMERLVSRAMAAGELNAEGMDDAFVHLLDSTLLEFGPGAERVLAILEKRGWRGWTRIERVSTPGGDTVGP